MRDCVLEMFFLLCMCTIIAVQIERRAGGNYTIHTNIFDNRAFTKYQWTRADRS